MDNSSSAAIPAPIRQPGTFFGEPRALGFLAFTEAWERFSYYGMTALLVLYMSEALFLPGHIEHVAGFAAFRAGLESVFGPMTTVGLASQVYGLYTAFVYFTPVLGGYVADRWISRRTAVTVGAVSMSAGHIAMAFDATFLLALTLLIVGCGLLKGNISTQVGTLYRQDDAAGRTRGFSIFSIGINVGAVVGPLACGLLAQVVGWHAGFGLAGILMLMGLATYLIGYREVADSVVHAGQGDAQAVASSAAPLDRKQWRIVICLIGAMIITIFQSIAYYQNSNVALIWIEHAVDLNVAGFHVPAAWFNSIDPLASIIGVPVLLVFWRRQARTNREPGEAVKIGIGAWIACGANLLLVAACVVTDHVPLLVPVVYDILLGIAFLYYWPTLLALVSRAAPPRVRATLMGTVFLTLFVADFLVGWLGTLYEGMGPTAFWTMHAGIAAAGGVLALLFGRWLDTALADAHRM